jgi:hypothetical protein
MSPLSIVTPTTVDDYDDIGRLVQAHIEYERSAASPPADWPERVARLIDMGKLIIYLARSDEQAVGYASEPFAHLDCLYIADGHRP